MSPYPFSPKKSYRTTGLIASKRSDRNANGRRARKSTERKEDATVLKRSSESNPRSYFYSRSPFTRALTQPDSFFNAMLAPSVTLYAN
ncbi:hypothetical protein TNCV_4688871 [Trichonephila clavipes]|nr:hypothetical protein TNCV_4688871 [Trichonephila clavipes]